MLVVQGPWPRLSYCAAGAGVNMLPPRVLPHTHRLSSLERGSGIQPRCNTGLVAWIRAAVWCSSYAVEYSRSRGAVRLAPMPWSTRQVCYSCHELLSVAIIAQCCSFGCCQPLGLALCHVTITKGIVLRSCSSSHAVYSTAYASLLSVLLLH